MFDSNEKLVPIISSLHDTQFLPPYARVLLRADANVPLTHGIVSEAFRLKRVMPTLDALLQKKAFIRFITHIDTPHSFEPELSTRAIAQWLCKHGYTTVTVEENVRFDPREYTQSIEYAQELKRDATHYINDAFGSLHRTDTSLTTLAELFAPQCRSMGLLVEEELCILSRIRLSPQRPVVVVLGGGKRGKLQAVEHLLPYADTILLCPALSYFARSHPILSSHKRIFFPHDYLMSSSYPWQPPFHVIQAHDDINPQHVIAIGPKTIALWKPILETAGTIIFNGPMGDLAHPQTTVELHELLSIIAHSPAFSLVGGGDSVHALSIFGLMSKISYCSTGGGSMLAYLGGDQLPSLEILKGCL
jgi:phosphoglycerate kinase